MTGKRKASRNGWGKIRRLPSGRYQASHVGPDGERHTAPMTFTAKLDASAWLARQRTLIGEGKWTSAAARADLATRQAVTLRVYAEQWLTERTNSRGERLRPRTVHEYRRLLAGPLDPLADRLLTDITAAVVRSWRSALLDTGKLTTTARAYGLLNAIMSTAKIDALIPKNPCRITGGGSTTTGRKVLPPTDAELDIIVGSITPRFRALVLIAAEGGLRYGELIELRRKDLTRFQMVVTGKDDDGNDTEITLDMFRVTVARAVTHTDAGFHVGQPKSAAGVRSVALPSDITAAIAAHLHEHAGRFPDSLLFPAADGVSHLAQSTFTKHWYPARATAGREDMPFHALRHFASTEFSKTGATDRETMDRLGQSTPSVAMRYQHSTGRDAELAARMVRRP